MYRAYDKKSIIKMIQKYLSSVTQNSNAPIPTGIYDDRTKEAVSSFQKVSGIIITGKVDALTLELLYKAYLDEELKERIKQKTHPLIVFPILPSTYSEGLSQIHRIMATLLDFYGHYHKIQNTNYYNEQTAKAVNILRKIYLLDDIDEIDEELYYRIINDINSINKPKYVLSID